MTLRMKALVCVVVLAAVLNFCLILHYPTEQWLHFFVYLFVVLLSSGMKVGLPKSDATMSVDFPFIFLAILQLSPLQAAALAICSVFAQCRIKVLKAFTLVQIVFNLANVTTATLLMWWTYTALVRHGLESAPGIAVAATVYFGANTVPVALIIAWSSGASPLNLWRQNFAWYLPFYLVGAGLAVTANLINQHFGWMTSLLLIPLMFVIYRVYSTQLGVIRDRERHIEEIEALHLRTMEGLALAVEAKDQNTHGHLHRVRVYVSEVGKQMGLDESMMKALVTASFLHDIGKIAVPEHILKKPGKLTPEEFEKIKIHPIVGADILERVRFPYPVVPIVRSHHEAWDGSGYPDGLKGEEIPIGARILSVIDCFDALASDRPYRKAMPAEEAIAYLESNAETKFDPDIVRLLALHYREWEEKTLQQTDSIVQLNIDISVPRGLAPAAGFASESDDESTTKKAAAHLAATFNAVRQPTGEQMQAPVLAAEIKG
jgi:putative nucleotidyltransferase with HDIG domain